MFGVFEHLGRFEALDALREISRVLVPGGIFKFDVPDLDWFVSAYISGNDPDTGRPLGESGRDEEWVLKSIFGGQDGPGQFHKWGYGKRHLDALLARPEWGFAEVRFIGRQWRDPEHNHLIYECKKNG